MRGGPCVWSYGEVRLSQRRWAPVFPGATALLISTSTGPTALLILHLTWPTALLSLTSRCHRAAQSSNSSTGPTHWLRSLNLITLVPPRLLSLNPPGPTALLQPHLNREVEAEQRGVGTGSYR
ncbi:unnamed protein product [Boreogadus saida]